MSDHFITATNGAGSTQPLAVEGPSQASRRSRNVIHDLLDGSIGVSYVAPRPRSGDMVSVYTDRAEAFAAFDLYAEETSFTYTNAALPELGMSFVLDGSLDIDQDDELPSVWYVRVGFQEV